jgi:cytochrome c oxidase assembly protein subunit 15
MTWLRRLSTTALVLQMVLVVTGTAVRVTGSGLGCPTWPRCTGGSLANTAELGSHGYIEFGNRLLAVVMEVVGIALVLAVRRHAPRLFRLSLVQAAVVPLQAVIGGLLVLSGLNPYVLILHFLTSFPLVLAAATLLSRVNGTGVTATSPVSDHSGSVHGMVRVLSGGVVAATSVVLALGALVTGTGPHAGSEKVERLPFNPRDITQLHADGVFLLTGLVIATVAVAWRTPWRPWALALLGLVVAQAGVGYWQYFTGSPAALVAVHVALATTLFTTASWLLLSTGRATVVPPARSAQPLRQPATGTVTAP